MELFEAMSTQRSMRRLKPDPVPDSVIRQILDSAICAPRRQPPGLELRRRP